jgi:MATE family multidrug resistance protein
MPGIGFSLATTALVGQAVGAGRIDEARAVTNVAMRWATIWMGGLGALFILFAPQMVGIFSGDPQLIAIGATAVQVVALAQPLWAGTFVIGGALRGIGDTRTPMVISGILGWTAVGIALLLVYPSGPHSGQSGWHTSLPVCRRSERCGVYGVVRCVEVKVER